jgi:hypothetical protein
LFPRVLREMAWRPCARLEDNVKRRTMKTCRLCAKRKPLEQFVIRRASTDGKTSVCRPCERVRKAGRKSRSGLEPRTGIYWQRIPVDRLRPHLKLWLKANHGRLLYQDDPTFYRAVSRLLHELETVTFDFADQFLIRIGMDYLWHDPPEAGGLGDLYDSVLVSAGPGGLSADTGHVPLPSSGRGRTPKRKVVA